MPRSLLLTLDAFGTLFHPRQPIASQYASAAATFNIPISPELLQPAFKASFKSHSLSHPNYGRDQVLRGEYPGPRQWWTDVIRDSFSRALASNTTTTTTSSRSSRSSRTLPDALIQDLLDRFASKRGYALYDDVSPFFARLRARKRPGARLGVFDRVVVGVISNSDDRVPAVLESLGVSVGDARGGGGGGCLAGGFEEERRRRRRESLQVEKEEEETVLRDVDLVVTSYQAGAEKPGALIFEEARRQAQRLFDGSDGGDADWTCVHVGDDYRKDYCGAVDAGWKAYLLPRDTRVAGEVAGEALERELATIRSLLDLIPELEAYK